MNLPRKIFLILIPICLYAGSLVLLAENPTQQGTEDTPIAAIEDSWDKFVNWPTVTKNIIFLYFAATLVEAGLGVLFRWRIWVRYFDSKGIKVPIIIAYSALLVKCTETDPVYEIFKEGLSITGMRSQWETTGILSALLIAGGSAGIIELYKKLRLRDNGEVQERKKDTERSKRRFKLTNVTRKDASPKLPIQVILDKKIVGTIATGKNSFAAFAGYEINTEKPHTLKLQGYNKDGEPIESTVISDFELAPGTIAEFEGTL